MPPSAVAFDSKYRIMSQVKPPAGSSAQAVHTPAVVMLPGGMFLLVCAVVAGILLWIGRTSALPTSLLAAEVFATILGLFFFGSFKYQIHKNALTYGMLLIIVATFCGLSNSVWHIGYQLEWLVGLDRSEFTIVPRFRWSHPCRYHVIYSRLDVLRLGHCADPLA